MDHPDPIAAPDEDAAADTEAYVGPLIPFFLLAAAAVFVVVITGTARRFTDPRFAVPFFVFLVLGGILMALLNLYGVNRALDQRPIPDGVGWRDGVKQALLASDSARSRFMARHPWLTLVMQLAVLAFICAGGAGKWAFYSSH